LRFSDGHLLDGRVVGGHGGQLGTYAGLCLETQHFPDSPNQPTFPPVVLRPEDRFASTTTWRFSAD
jgi:aldose 1-epimerase